MSDNPSLVIFLLGLPAPRPAFMHYARQSLKTANESSESDEEWTPKPIGKLLKQWSLSAIFLSYLKVRESLC